MASTKLTRRQAIQKTPKPEPYLVSCQIEWTRDAIPREYSIYDMPIYQEYDPGPPRGTFEAEIAHMDWAFAASLLGTRTVFDWPDASTLVALRITSVEGERFADDFSRVRVSGDVLATARYLPSVQAQLEAHALLALPAASVREP